MAERPRLGSYVCSWWPACEGICTIPPTSSKCEEDPHFGSSHEDLSSMPKVVFVKEKQELEVPEGANLRTEAMKAGIQIYQGPDKIFNCRGNGLCGTCKVLVKKGMENLSPK